LLTARLRSPTIRLSTSISSLIDLIESLIDLIASLIARAFADSASTRSSSFSISGNRSWRFSWTAIGRGSAAPEASEVGSAAVAAAAWRWQVPMVVVVVVVVVGC